MTPTERAAVAEAIAALEPLAQIRFDLDGFSFDMADIVFEGKLLATFRTTLDHHRFSKAVVNAQAALTSLRAIAPARVHLRSTLAQEASEEAEIKDNEK